MTSTRDEAESSQFKSIRASFDPSAYEKGGFLGSGAFGSVSKVKRTVTSDDPDIPDDAARKKIIVVEADRQKVIKECEILATLKHPNTLELFCWKMVATNGAFTFYLYTEFCDCSFKQFLDKNSKHVLCLLDVKVISRQLIEGLAYLHKNQVVHRDLKPDNILVVNKRNLPCKVLIKLGDFGLSKFLLQAVGSCMSQDFTLCGTRPYMPPEIIQGLLIADEDNKKTRTRHPYSTDIFSLGVVIYEVITKEKPFESKHLLKKSFNGSSIIKKKVAAPKVSKALALMMDWNPGNRPEAQNIFQYFEYDVKDIATARSTGVSVVVDFTLIEPSQENVVSSKASETYWIKLLSENKELTTQKNRNQKRTEGDEKIFLFTENIVIVYKCLMKGFDPKDYIKDIKLGEGAFGSVRKYRRVLPMYFSELPAEIALKKVSLFRSTWDNEMREYEVLQILDHKNIVKLLYWEFIRDGENSGQLRMYTELCDKNLKTFMKHNVNLKPIEIKILCRQLLFACDYLHKNKVVHRDIKPENILVNRGQQLCTTVLKIGDFGLARFINQSSMKTTQDLSAVGTLYYTSPEMIQAMADDYTYNVLTRHPYAVDIFSLGVVIFELISKKVPFTMQELCTEHFDGKDIILGNILHPKIADALLLMLQWKSDKRPMANRVLDYFSYDIEELDTASALYMRLYDASKDGELKEVKQLLEIGIDLNIVVHSETSPLYVASKNGKVEVVKCLLEAGANVNLGNQNGATPLYVASQNGYVELVKLLLENKADVHQATKDNGITPLFIGCQKGQTEIVRLLIANGANVNQSNRNGITPFFIATSNGHNEVVKLLREQKDLSLDTTFNTCDE